MDEPVRILERTAWEIDEALAALIVRLSRHNALIHQFEDVLNFDKLNIEFWDLVVDLLGIPAENSVATGDASKEFCRDGLRSLSPDFGDETADFRAVSIEAAREFIALCRCRADETWRRGWMPVIYRTEGSDDKREIEATKQLTQITPFVHGKDSTSRNWLVRFISEFEGTSAAERAKAMLNEFGDI
jgi:hypothetical protein